MFNLNWLWWFTVPPGLFVTVAIVFFLVLVTTKGAIHNLARSILPSSLLKSIEAESRKWRLRCPCGYDISVWEAGGIRWKAVGNPKKLMRCPECQRMQLFNTYHEQAETNA